MHNNTLRNLVASLAAVTAIAVSAPSFAEGNFYLGASVSQAFVDELGLDEDDTGGKIFAGYRLNDYFSVEASYYDFGDIEERNSNLEVDGVSIAAIGSYPLTDSFSVFAKVGAHDWDAETSGLITNQLSRDSDTDAFFGLGAEYQFHKNLSVRAEVERFEVEELDLDVASVGLSFNF